MDLTEAEDIKKRWQEYTEVKSLSRVRLFATPWTVAYQAPLSMGFSKQECWSGLPFPSPGDLPDPGIEPRSPALQAGALPSELPGKPQTSHSHLFCPFYGKFTFTFYYAYWYTEQLSPGRLCLPCLP